MKDVPIHLHALAGIVLDRSFSVPEFPSWAGTTSLEQTEFLFDEIDCLWQIYNSLRVRDSLGLPLQPIQARTHGCLVTLVHGCKPVAEGSIIGNHTGFLDTVMDEIGSKTTINVSASRSLIEITKVSHLFSSTYYYFTMGTNFIGGASPWVNSFIAQTDHPMDFYTWCKSCGNNITAADSW